MNNWNAAAWIAPAALLALAAPLGAQESRATLIDRARNEFDDTARLDLLMAALSPERESPDSLWAVAAYDLAQVLLGADEARLASVWLRFAVRHAPQWPVDRAWFPPSVVEAYEEAVSAVEAEGPPGDAAARTEWRWPTRFDASASGTVEVGSAEPTVALSVTLEGRGFVEPGSVFDAPPGTYDLLASAEGYESVRLSREILPGVATVVTFDLPALLAADVRSSATRKLVRITYLRGGQQVCENGYLAGAEGLVLTTLGGIRNAGPLRVTTSDGAQVFDDVTVATADTARNVAVLKLDAGFTEAFRAAAGAEDGQRVWAVHFAGCGLDTASPTRLSGWSAAPTGPVGIAPPLPATAVGAPLIDQEGALLALVSDATAVVPAALTRDALDRARRDLLAAQVQPGGGFPWVWVGAGAAAAGLAAVLVGGGGGGGDGDGNGTVPPPTTGGIVITFPP